MGCARRRVWTSRGHSGVGQAGGGGGSPPSIPALGVGGHWARSRAAYMHGMCACSLRQTMRECRRPWGPVHAPCTTRFDAAAWQHPVPAPAPACMRFDALGATHASRVRTLAASGAAHQPLPVCTAEPASSCTAHAQHAGACQRCPGVERAAAIPVLPWSAAGLPLHPRPLAVARRKVLWPPLPPPPPPPPPDIMAMVAWWRWWHTWCTPPPCPLF